MFSKDKKNFLEFSYLAENNNLFLTEKKLFDVLQSSFALLLIFTIFLFLLISIFFSFIILLFLLF